MVSDRLKNKHGAVLVLVAIGIVALIGFTALVIDVGRLYVAKQKAQNVADGAAIAGASQLGLSWADAETEARSIVTTNNTKAPAWSVDGVQVTPTEYNGVPGVKVYCGVTVGYGFAGVLGFTNGRANATAIAIRSSRMIGLDVAPLVIMRDTLFEPGTDPNSGEPVAKYDPGDLLYPEPKVDDWKNNPIGSGNFGYATYPNDDTNAGQNAVQDRFLGDVTGPTIIDLNSTLDVMTKPGNAKPADIVYGKDTGTADYRLMNEPYHAVTDAITGVTQTAWDLWSADFLSGNEDWKYTYRLLVVPIIEGEPYEFNGRSVVSVIGYAVLFIDGERDGAMDPNLLPCRFVAAVINDGALEYGWTDVLRMGTETEIVRTRLVQ